MEIRIIRKGLEAFEYKFEPFEWDSKHSNANSKHLKVIGSIRMQIRAIQEFRNILMKIRAIRKGFKAFTNKF